MDFDPGSAAYVAHAALARASGGHPWRYTRERGLELAPELGASVDGLDELRRESEAALARAGSLEIELVHDAPASERRYLDFRGSFIEGALYGVAFDITRQRENELRVHEAHNRLQALLSAVTDDVIRLSADGIVRDARMSTGQIQMFDVDAASTFPTPASPTAGRPLVGSGLHASLVSNILALTADALRTQERLNLTVAVDSPRSQEWQVACVPISRDEVMCVIRDTTELRRAQTERLQSNKLSAIGQLAAGIAHEINTPVQYISDNTSFVAQAVTTLLGLVDALLPLARGEAPAAEAEATLERRIAKARLPFLRAELPRAIEQTEEGIQRVTNIVGAMKDFSHPSGGHKALYRLHDLLKTTGTVSRNEWKYVAELDIEVDAEVGEVECLKDELSQVFLNLIVNAAHAIGERQKDDPRLGHITIRAHRGPDGVHVSVSDDGCGIPETHRARIFEPFFTTKPVGSGTGQGLAIAYSVVVDKHGGSITFDSTVGVGTTFEIVLPDGAQRSAA